MDVGIVLDMSRNAYDEAPRWQRCPAEERGFKGIRGAPNPQHLVVRHLHTHHLRYRHDAYLILSSLGFRLHGRGPVPHVRASPPWTCSS